MPAADSGVSDAATATTSRAAASEVGAKADFETQTADLTFADLLDIVNPLQHVPVISDLYRELTGDQIKPQARVLGGMLFGGPVGLVSAVASVAAEETGGRDLGGTVVAALFGPESPSDAVAASAGRVQQATPPGGSAEPPAPSAKASTPAQSPTPAPAPPAAAKAKAATAPAATRPAGTEAAAQPQVGEPQAEAPAPVAALPADGPLTGKAAIAAYMNDMRAVARAASTPSGVALAAAQQRVPAAAAEPEAKVPANLLGLGLRDKRGRLVTGAPANPVPVSSPGGLASTSSLLTSNAHRNTATSGSRAASAVPSPRLPANTTGLPPVFLTGSEPAGPAGPAHPAAGEPVDFSQQMMHALKKYESMIESRHDGAAQPE